MAHWVVASLVTALALGPAAEAQHAIELVPLVGVRGGENLEADLPGAAPATADPDVSFGLAVDFFVRSDAWFEVFVDHQTLHFTSESGAFGTSEFDVAVDYLQFGGGYGPAKGRVRPYVTAGVGLTRYGTSAGEARSTIGASGSLGGGMRVPIGKRLAFRFELRGFATATDVSVSVACGPGCYVKFAANGWYQFAGTVGLAIRL